MRSTTLSSRVCRPSSFNRSSRYAIVGLCFLILLTGSAFALGATKSKVSGAASSTTAAALSSSKQQTAPASVSVKTLQTSVSEPTKGVSKSVVTANGSKRSHTTIQLSARELEEQQRVSIGLALTELATEENARITVIARGDGANVQKIIDETTAKLGTTFQVVKRTHGRGRERHTHFLIAPDHLIPHGNHFHKASETMRDQGFIFLVLVVVIIVSQFGMAIWKSKHVTSFNIAVLLGLWLNPAGLAFMMGYWRFIVVWTIFSIICLRLVGLATRKSIEGQTPRKVYTWFLYSYKLAQWTAILGYVFVMLALLGIPALFYPNTPLPPGSVDVTHTMSPTGAAGGANAPPFVVSDIGADRTSAGSDGSNNSGNSNGGKHAKPTDGHGHGPGHGHDHGHSHGPTLVGSSDYTPQSSNVSFAATGFVLICYGLYFGVLGRDVAAVCFTRMANTIGYRQERKSTGAGSINNSGSNSSTPKRLSENTCAICDDLLYQSVRHADVDMPLPPPSQRKVAEGDEKVYSLDCGHSFHEFCIRGWLMVGKQDTCAYCHEKCTLKQHFGRNPWEIQNVLWSGLLDIPRYVLVFNPFLVLVSQVVLLIVY